MTQSIEKPKTFHGYRGRLLEACVIVEYRLDDAIAAAYAQSFSVAQELRGEILTRLPIQQRVRILKRIMEARGLTDRYPFVLPVLDKLFKVRNVFAHTLGDGYDEKADSVALVGMKDGEVIRHVYKVEFLQWLEREAGVIQRELSDMSFAIAPKDDRWHES